MTICMGALCAAESGGPCTAVVVASDRMVTLGGLIEFDHSAPKTSILGPNVVGLVAGDALAGSELIQMIQSTQQSQAPAVIQVAQNLAQQYTALRLARAEAAILLPRGLSIQAFHASHQQLLAQIVGMIDNQLVAFDLGVQFLIAGLDADGGHLLTVVNPGGRYDIHDVIGYAAIGSGALHALQAMIGFGHSTSQDLRESVFRAFAAKRRAEVAPGVGRETDLLVIKEDGVNRLAQSTLEELDALYTEFTESTAKNLGAKLHKLELVHEAIGA
jgi:20S proteasome alpha/beta subunit